MRKKRDFRAFRGKAFPGSRLDLDPVAYAAAFDDGKSRVAFHKNSVKSFYHAFKY